MSTVRTDNFGPSAGGTTYSARGIAKAWVNFDGTGTIAARDSENVSSLTDNGTGDYTVNIGNDMADGNYCASITCNDDRNAGNSSAAATVAGSVGVLTRTPDATSFQDATIVNVAILGDLA